jgi:hypothetical protein
MLYSLLALGLAAGSAAISPDSTATQFVAALAAESDAPRALRDAQGAASIILSNDQLLYHVTLQNLEHVTNVAVVDEGRAVELASPGDTRTADLDIHGVVPVSRDGNIPLGELLDDLRGGKAEVVVFTTNEPGGAMTGRLVPGQSSSVQPPAPVEAPTT